MLSYKQNNIIQLLLLLQLNKSLTSSLIIFIPAVNYHVDSYRFRLRRLGYLAY